MGRTVDMTRRIGWMKGIVAALVTAVAWNALSFVTTAGNDQTEAPYSQVMEKWRAEGAQEAEDVFQAVAPSDFTGAEIVGAEDSFGYGGSAARMDKGDSVSLTVTLEEAGLYGISVEYYCLADKAVSHTVSLKVNGGYPFSECRELILEQMYDAESWPFRTDSRGDEITPDTSLRYGWQSRRLKSARQGGQEALLFYLEKGENELEFTVENPPYCWERYVCSLCRSIWPMRITKRFSGGGERSVHDIPGGGKSILEKYHLHPACGHPGCGGKSLSSQYETDERHRRFHME